MYNYKAGEYYYGYLFGTWYFIKIIRVYSSGINISVESRSRTSILISRNDLFKHEFSIGFVNNKIILATFIKIIEDED